MIFEPIGTGTALVTPFDRNNTVDFDALQKLLEFNSVNNVEYLVVQGTTGESATCSKEEKKAILQFVLENNIKSLPIVYGIGGNNTAEIVDTIKTSDLHGVAALLSVSPYYNKPTQEGIYRHFVTLADISPVPIIVYNVPGRTSSNILAETTIRLSEHPNIIGMKEASGDLVQCMQIAKSSANDFYLISGDDLLTVPMISIGAKGVISVISNGYPAEFSEMVRLALKGNFPEASDFLYEFLKINPPLFEESNPVGIKEVLKLRGICDNYVRLPLLPASASLSAKIKEVSSKYL